ncbi:MAG TPA: hypothetical protein VGQ62_04250 [Chloroflexota bacterium]|nr:hypothetical protein [Chloroflexota bacterium]
MPLPRGQSVDGVIRPASPFFRLLVDEDGLTNALLEFVTDPRATRNDMPVIQDLYDLAPNMVPVLEAMLLDGVEDRADVADYVRASVYGIS